MSFNESEIQSEDIRLTGKPVNDVVSDLHAVRGQMAAIAMAKSLYVTVHHEQEDGVDHYRLKGIPKADFEKMPIQCPTAADREYEAQANEARGFPSMLATPRGQVIVSQREACVNCTNYLFRAANGHCVGKQFSQS